MMPFAHQKQKELTLYSWKQEDPLEGMEETRSFGTGPPTAASTRPNPISSPKPCLPLGTFLAPSFSAFFLASSKSSFWPTLA